MMREIEDDMSRLISQAERWLRLEVADKMVVLMTCIIVSAVMFALIASAVFFLSMGIMKAIAVVIGNEMVSCFIVGAVLLLIALAFFMRKQSLVENKVVESVYKQMLEDDDTNETNGKGV